MKWDTLRKKERNRLLVEYHQSHPELSMAEIGKIFNISKQRVSIILKGEGNEGKV